MSDEESKTPAEDATTVDVSASVESDPDAAPFPSNSETTSETTVEEFKINGNAVVQKVQELIQQGNIRRIVIKSETGKILFELPLTIGVAGGLIATLFAPLLIALGFVGMLAARLTIVVEKTT